MKIVYREGNINVCANFHTAAATFHSRPQVSTCWWNDRKNPVITKVNKLWSIGTRNSQDSCWVHYRLSQRTIKVIYPLGTMNVCGKKCSRIQLEVVKIIVMDQLTNWQTDIVYSHSTTWLKLNPALSCGEAQGLAAARWNENKQDVRRNHICQTVNMWMHQHIFPSVPQSQWPVSGAPQGHITDWQKVWHRWRLLSLCFTTKKLILEVTNQHVHCL